MKKRFIIYAIAILISVFSYVMTDQSFLGEIELAVEDRIYQRPQDVPLDIKIIAIDEQSLEKLGPYNSWDRSYFTQLINLLNADENCKPKVIGFDILFTGNGNTEVDSELVLAAQQAGNVVVSSKLEFSEKATRTDSYEYDIEYLVKAELLPFEELSQVVDTGFANPLYGLDGYLRYAYDVIESEGKTFKSFAYTIAEKAYGSQNLRANKGQFGLKYTGYSGDFEIVPMSEVLSGKVDAYNFKDCIVLIGAYEEGMADSYSVPVDHSKYMYGVEVQANIICAIKNNLELKYLSSRTNAIIALVVVFLFTLFIFRGSLKGCFIKYLGLLLVYGIAAYISYIADGICLNLLYIPVLSSISVVAYIIYRYIASQKQRIEEMEKTLFSMADSMAEAIEGRTPYNASHTKNVAKRCVEMLEYINKLHKEKKTGLHFSKADINRMYLAAMLHDIGKMDVPLEVMDKPTKLGHLEKTLKSRLTEIKLRIDNSFLKGEISSNEKENNLKLIDSFLGNLGGLNCGRPLKSEEIELIELMKKTVYNTGDGENIPYLTDEEYDDLLITAGTLSESERTVMQSHVVHTDKILSHVYFGEEFKNVRSIAANHHELLNGKGYPNHISGHQIDTMTRILTIMDIYDSLIADDRPYKKPKSVKIAFEILDEEAKAGKVDKDLLEIAKQIWLVDSIEA